MSAPLTLRRLIPVMGLVCLVGCSLDTGGGDSDSDGASPVTDADTVDDSDDGPSVVIGTHKQWKQQPEHFVELGDGDELPIVLGHQGLWMVVLAVRSLDTMEGELDIVARIETADMLLGELLLVDQELDPELDGHDYIYDIWLIVSDPSLATYTAELTVEMEDSNGLALTLERSLILSGGTL